MKIYNVVLESSPGNYQAIITEYKEHRISVTEMCEKLAQYGLQVVRLGDTFIRLQMDVTNGGNEAILTFEVEL